MVDYPVKATSSVDRKPMVVIDAGIAIDKNLKMLKIKKEEQKQKTKFGNALAG